MHLLPGSCCGGTSVLEASPPHLVVAQANGRPIDRRTNHDVGTRLLLKAGVRHVRLHDGRHTAATLLLSGTVHPRVVLEPLDHSRMRTTMDIYSHVMPALAREAAHRMSTLLCPVEILQLQPETNQAALRMENGLSQGWS